MRRLILGATLAASMGSAYAGDLDRLDQRRYEANDYSAKLFYRLEFGGSKTAAQTMGLRLDNEFAESRGAPAAFQLAYDGSGSASVKVRGMELRSPVPGNSFLEDLSTLQLVGIAMTVVVVGLTVSEGIKSNNSTTTNGSGSGA